MGSILKYPTVFALGFGVTYLLTPVLRRLGAVLGMVDMPDRRRVHRTPMARSGGLAVFAGFHAACAAVFLLPWMPFHGTLDAAWWGRFLVTSSLLVLLGIADDAFDLRPWLKLAGQFAVSALAFSLGMNVGKFLGVELPLALDLALTVIWFLAVINAFNLIDGIDGLATGIAALAACGLGGSFILRRMPGDVLVLAGFLGSCLAFLRFNFHPASVFLGDSGSMFLGFTFAAVAVSTGAKGTALATVAVPLLAVGVPLFDTVLAIWRRAVRGAPDAAPVDGTPSGIFRPDREHLHHRLVENGLSQGAVAGWLYLASAVLTSVGLLTMVFRTQALGIYLVAFVVAAFVVVRHIARVELWDSGTAILTGLERPPSRVLAAVLYPPLDLLALVASFSTVLFFAREEWSGAQFKTEWLELLPMWVGIPFLTLALSGVYRRVWSRARVSEYVFLALAVVAGVVLTGGVAGIVLAEPPFDLCRRMLIFMGMALPLLTGARAFPRVVQDAMSWRKDRQLAADPALRNVLVIGAGYSCTLFLRSQRFDPLGSEAPRRVVGLVDDDRNLQGRVVYGYRVLGRLDDVVALCETHAVHEMVVTDPLPEERRVSLSALARERELRLLQWAPEVRPV